MNAISRALAKRDRARTELRREAGAESRTGQSIYTTAIVENTRKRSDRQ